jgi:hypothetical protein
MEAKLIEKNDSNNLILEVRESLTILNQRKFCSVQYFRNPRRGGGGGGGVFVERK